MLLNDIEGFYVKFEKCDNGFMVIFIKKSLIVRDVHQKIHEWNVRRSGIYFKIIQGKHRENRIRHELISVEGGWWVKGNSHILFSFILL